jgi:glycosyltransferase involved in cell wall biosynthesis
MRILHVISSLGPGGAERQLTLLANAQAASGHDVGIVVNSISEKADPNHFFYLTALSSSIEVFEICDHRVEVLLHISQLKKAVNRFSPNIVQTWNYTACALLMVATEMNGRIVCVSHRTSYEHFISLRRQRPWIFFAYLAGLKLSSAVIVNSEHARKGFSQITFLEKKLSFIPNCVADDRFVEPDPQCLIQPPSIVTVVGRHIISKKVDVVIQALHLLGDFPNVKLEIIGEGVETRNLVAMATSLGLKNRVCFRGVDHDWWRHQQANRILVSMSQFEGTPNVVLEAMAASIPLIVSDIPGHREIVTEAEALIVPSDNAQSLRAAIEIALTAHEERSKRVVAAFRAACEFRVSAAQARHEGLYGTLSNLKNS